MEDRDPTLADAVEELAETLERLREELREGEPRPQRGPFGVPRPPTPREVLRLTEGYAIPTLVAVLETSVRVLELLGAAIRIADGRPLDDAGAATYGTGSVPAAGVTSASRRTLERLDDALADLQQAAAGGNPSNPELRDLLEQARNLRAEVDRRLTEATSRADQSTELPSEAMSEASPDGDEGAGVAAGSDREDRPERSDSVPVDVESELESIKREVGAHEGDATGDDGAEAPDDGTDADGEDDAAGGSGEGDCSEGADSSEGVDGSDDAAGNEGVDGGDDGGRGADGSPGP